MKGLVSTIIAGTVAAQVGLTGLDNEDSVYQNQQKQVSAAVELMVPTIGDMVPTSMTITVRSEIQNEVHAGVHQLDRSFRQVPVYVVKVAHKVEEHGIAALAYEDTDLKEQGRALGTEIGQGIRHFALALGKDLVLTAHESGLAAR